eukprot:811266-Pleurochrysis_carterae.AAC.6
MQRDAGMRDTEEVSYLEQMRISECADVVADARNEVRLAILEAVLLKEGAREGLRLAQVRGRHHGPQVVLRLQRDVAGEDVHYVTAGDVARRPGRLLDERHLVVAAVEDVLAVVRREDHNSREKPAHERHQRQVRQLVLKRRTTASKSKIRREGKSQ